MWAEWYRHLAERGIPPLMGLPRDAWRCRVAETRVADLSTAGRLARVGLPPPTPGRRTWPAFQQAGETLWREGWPGLLAPSAARPEGLALCLFVEDPARVPVEPVPPPNVVDRPPVPPTGMRT